MCENRVRGRSGATIPSQTHGALQRCYQPFVPFLAPLSIVTAKSIISHALHATNTIPWILQVIQLVRHGIGYHNDLPDPTMYMDWKYYDAHLTEQCVPESVRGISPAACVVA